MTIWYKRRMANNLPDKERNWGGAPTLYRDYMPAMVVELGRAGYSKQAMAAKLGVSYRSLFLWRDKYPELADALELAQELSQAHWEGILKDQATGHSDGNATSAIFAMKNMFPDNYRDRREYQVEQKQTVEINFLGLDEEAEVMEAEFERVD